MLRAEPRELARLVVVAAVGLEVLLLRLVLGGPGLAARLGQAGAAEQITTVERMPRSARIISGFSSSSCSRTARSSRRVMNSGSSQASR